MGRLVQAYLPTFREICCLQFQTYINHAQTVQINTFLFRILPLHVSAVNNHPQGINYLHCCTVHFEDSLSIAHQQTH
jgi:hypothetical protein